MLQPATLPTGHRLGGRYEILRVLGIGGSAVVYAARDTHIGDEIALKVLRPEKSSDVLIRRSRREAGIASGLSHPGLVRIFEFASSANRVVFLHNQPAPMLRTGHQQIARLHVAMHDPVFVQNGECFEDLYRECDCPVDRQRS